MPDTKPAYDLFVLIDPDVPDERRTGIVENVKERVSSGDGVLKGDVEWGTRRLAYEIKHRSDAYYHLFQIEASPDLLETLNRSLSIDDGVLRHRIIRLPKGAPDEPPKAPSQARQAEPSREGKPGRRPEAAPVGEEPGTPASEEGEATTPTPGDDQSGTPAPDEASVGARSGDEPAAAGPGGDEPAAPESSQNDGPQDGPA